jgi:CopG family transcriptional regulator/antitoxin EndoAI
MVPVMATAPRQRVNITLPGSTLRLLDRVAGKGNRSRLIDEAVRQYVADIGKAKLRARLKEGAQRRGERNRQLAAEWFAIDEEAWTAAAR